MHQDVPKLSKTAAERVREFRLRQKLKSQLLEEEKCDSSSSHQMKPSHAKTTAERVREFRLRQKLKCQLPQEEECDSSSSHMMKPSHAKTNEYYLEQKIMQDVPKLAKTTAERVREFRLRQKLKRKPKRAKTAAERMREFRLRQKLKYQRCEEEECDSSMSDERKVKCAETSFKCSTEFHQCKKIKSKLCGNYKDFRCGMSVGISDGYLQKNIQANREEKSKFHHCEKIKIEEDEDSVEYEAINVNKNNYSLADTSCNQQLSYHTFDYKQTLDSSKRQYLPHYKTLVYSNYQRDSVTEANSSRLPFVNLKGLCLETSTHFIIVPPHFTDEITFTFDSAKASKVSLPELKSDESEEIEIIPDIHIADDGCPSLENDLAVENEYLGIKLKNFSNIHYQVISTPAAKLNDVHMILYLTTSAQNNIRRNVLEFSGYPFDESSTEYQCRRNLMEQMSLDDLKTVATVLCVSQYIVDESKNSLIDAILKFLLKPSALLNSSTIMPTISPAPVSRRSPVVKKKATSTSKTPQLSDILPEIVISEVKTLATDKEIPSNPVNNAAISSSNAISTEDSSLTSTPEFKKMTASLSNDIQIMPLPKTGEVKEEPIDADEPLSKVKSTVSIVPVRVPYVGSDDEDDKPLSKMIGHPNDDQLRLLVTKIVKESKLEDITMKTVIKKVFDAYPNFDLGYRKEFIKSIVRQILSQMDDQSCSVTTTVITI